MNKTPGRMSTFTIAAGIYILHLVQIKQVVLLVWHEYISQVLNANPVGTKHL